MNSKRTDATRNQGIKARSREFAQFEQVDKRQNYHLSEQTGEEEFDNDFEIESCDLGLWLHGDSKDRLRFADQLGGALQGIGFAILENTGIDAETYDRVTEKTLDLFQRIPLAEKLRFAAKLHGSVNQGYFPIKETSEIHPDLVEGWVFCRRAFDLERGADVDVAAYWPSSEFEAFFREHCLEHQRLILPVMQAILTYLGQDPRAFDARLDRPAFGLRLNYYPPVEASDAQSGAGRLLGHEDVNLFTLLPAPQVEGLQLLNRSNFKWIRLSAPRGTIILNTGDYMQRITNDRLPSTTHRVSQPQDPNLLSCPRVSFPLNVYLREEETLEVLPGLGEPRYEPIKAVTFHTRITSKYYGHDHGVDD